MCAGLDLFYFYVADFFFVRLVSRWVGWFLGALSVAAGACVRLVRAQPGERASPAPAEKSALPGAGAGTAAPGGVLLSTSQLEPWLRQRRRRRAPGPGRPGSPRSSRIVCRQLFCSRKFASATPGCGHAAAGSPAAGPAGEVT